MSHPTFCQGLAGIMKEITKYSEQDQVLKQVIQYTKEGWPNSKINLTDEAKMYFDYRVELSTGGSLLFRGERLVIPKLLRADIKKMLHVSHQAATTTINRARQLIFWPGMNSEIKDFINKYNVCNTFMNKQQKEPMLSDDIPAKPWQKVG